MSTVCVASNPHESVLLSKVCATAEPASVAMSLLHIRILTASILRLCGSSKERRASCVSQEHGSKTMDGSGGGATHLIPVSREKGDVDGVTVLFNPQARFGEEVQLVCA